MLKEFTIDSRDMKTTLACYKWEPKGEIKAILVLIHGMEDYVFRFKEMAEYLESEGILVAGVDLLGHGHSVKDKKDFGYFCDQDAATVLVRDVHRLKKTVQAEYPGIPVYLIGHSMGSFIARNYIERYGTGINGVIIEGGGDTPAIIGYGGKLLTSFISLFHGWHYRSPLCNKLVMGTFANVFPGEGEDAWITKRKECIEQYKNDPLTHFDFTTNGYHTLAELTLRAGNRKLIEKIPKDLPMFIVSGEDDPVGEMGKGVRRMYELYKAHGLKNVTLNMRKNDRHELHNETDRFQFFEEIKDFIIGK